MQLDKSGKAANEDEVYEYEKDGKKDNHKKRNWRHNAGFCNTAAPDRSD
jgi:hypothetical protein